MWHHEMHLDDELLQLPFPKQITDIDADKVVSVVKKLRDYHPQEFDFLNFNEVDIQRKQLEAELDEAVFDLYGISEAERDLIRDCCDVTLPFLYKPYNSVGILQAFDNNNTSWLQEYADRFAQRWQPYLNDDEVMRADLHIGSSGNMIAMEFYPSDCGDKWDLVPKKDKWDTVIEAIGKNLLYPIGTSQMLLDGMTYVVTKNSIIIIKRNEKRFWTRSLAREDAEATLVKTMTNRNIRLD